MVEVAKKAEKVSKDAPHKKRPEPVQMVEQTSSYAKAAEEKVVEEIDVTEQQPAPKKRQRKSKTAKK